MFRWDRLQYKANGEFAEDVSEPPTIAVEIVSPSQSVTALVRRCIWYVENGVEIAVLVDPADRSVVLFRPGQNPSVLTGDDAIRLDGVLDDFPLTVRELFARLLPPRPSRT